MVTPRRDDSYDDHDSEPLRQSLSDDLVLSDLRQAEQDYQEFRERVERQATEFRARMERQAAELHKVHVALEKAQAGNEDVTRQVEKAQAGNEDVTRRLDEARHRWEDERARAERQRERANQLADVLKDIHRALFSGNIYELILRACLTITGATRGVYVTVRGKDDTYRIRASIDVDGYPQSPPSMFIKALCARVLDANDPLVANGEDDLKDLPRPERTGERFHNLLVAPVVLLRNLNGVIIAADKMHGEFNHDDAETLLSVGDQAGVAVENVRLRRELQQAYLSTVAVMADAMEAKDPYTQGHCEMVSRYARLITDRLNLSDEERSIVYYAALLHDIGKIGVSDGVLNKPGPLLPAERDLVRSHVRVGHDLIQHVPAFKKVATAVLHHHEWYDGSGYPTGLRGEEIPIAARIVGTVDAYAAMISARSYKEAYSDAWARDELRRCAGAQFDPRIVDALLDILDTPEAVDEEEEIKGALLPGFGHLEDRRHAVS